MGLRRPTVDGHSGVNLLCKLGVVGPGLKLRVMGSKFPKAKQPEVRSTKFGASSLEFVYTNPSIFEILPLWKVLSYFCTL